MLLSYAIDWFKNNKEKLMEISIGEIDYYPSNGEDSFSFGFEANNFVYQIIIWEKGYIKLLRLDKQIMTEDIENIKIENSKEMNTRLDNFLEEILWSNMPH